MRTHTDQPAAALVQRAQAGEVGAFEGLYRQTHQRVYGLCLGMVGDVALAEELTQRAYVTAWRRLATFRGDSRFSTWMHRVAVNVVLNDRRSHARRIARVEPVADPEAGHTPAVPGRSDARMDLAKAVAALPPKARQVFVLHEVEGYRHDEIAAQMGISEGTSRAQLHRARTLLREALGR